MMDFQARSACVDDLPILKRFEQGVISAERPHAFNLREEEITYYDLPKLLESDLCELMVLEGNNQLVGCGYARIEQEKAHFEPAEFAYLGFMYIAPEFRGRGLLTTVMDHLFAWAKERGINTFKLDVFTGNQAAIKAYEKVGFRSHMIEMWFQEPSV